MNTKSSKNNEKKVKDNLIYAQSIANTIQEPLIVLGANLKVISANKSFYYTFKVDPKETIGQLIYDLGNGQWDIADLRKLLEEILPKNIVFNNYQIEHNFETIGKKTMLLNAGRLDSMEIILLAIEDITESQKAKEEARESEDKYRNLFMASRDAIMTLEPPSWKFTSGNPSTIKMFGVKNEAEFLQYKPWELSPKLQPDGRASKEKAKEMIETAMREGSDIFEWVHKRINDEEFQAEVQLSRVEYDGNLFLLTSVRDITGRKKTEELEKMNKMMVARELKMIELKEEIKKLEAKLQKNKQN